MMRTRTNRPLIIALISLLAYCAPTLAAEKFSHPARVIDAEVIDAGDYYLGLDSKPIRFKRKKDVFLKLDSIKTERQQKNQRKNANGQNTSGAAPRSFTPGFKRVNNHRWGALEIIKADQTQSGFSTRSQTTQQNANSAGLAPVFTSINGRGEYLILPDIMISFSSYQAVLQHKQAMLNQFGMHVKNQMMFSDTNFVLAFDAPVTDYAQVFRTTRDLMALPYIEWAEPNMQVKLKKTAAPDPNDHLFREQWGLYNWGLNGEFCDADTDIAADIDANDAWDLMDTISLPDFPRLDSNLDIILVPGAEPVIAIIDDGVNYNHLDIPLWSNPKISSGIPNPPSGNYCKDDLHGCDFGNFYIEGPNRVYNHSDSSTTTNPLPQTVNDTHGTQVAGIAGATRNNNIGIVGSAYNAEILPIRLDFDAPIDCETIQDALSYAAKYADIISNSWNLDSTDPDVIACQITLNAKLADITTGNNTSYKRGAMTPSRNTPVLFTSGNSGAGWQKVSIQVPTAGTLRMTLHKDLFDDVPGENAVWIDNITLPGNTSPETISSAIMPTDWSVSTGGTNDTTSAGSNIYSACTSATLTGDTPVGPGINHVLGGTGHSIVLNTAGDTCEYLEIENVSAGSLEFWVWVSLETWNPNRAFTGDLFRVYLYNSISMTSTIIGDDLISEGSQYRGINNEASVYYDTLAYPASHSDVIAVGASNDGSDSNDLFDTEDRAYFSQYGPTLDVVAPGTSIRSTTSSGGYGYLSGTSASTPMVAGIIANMLAVNPDLSLTDIKTHLQNGADEIGPNAGEFIYTSGFNKYYGHGRANSYKSTYLAAAAAGHDLSGFPVPPLAPPKTCVDPNPGAADDGFWLLMLPAILAGANKN